MQQQRQGWVFACPICGALASELEVRIGVGETALVDEDARSAALSPLRSENFSTILDLVEAVGVPDGTWLDVGCAHGWFMDAAIERGYDIVGIEPDAAVAEAGQLRGHAVVGGYFPDDLVEGETYSLIIFNDVLEHIPDPAGIAARASELLEPGGLLVINIPLSSGVFFRLAQMMDRLGAHAPLERMWQRNFPSPHLTYVRPDHVANIVRKADLSLIYSGSLRSVSTDGLWPRLRYDRRSTWLGSAFTWVATVAAMPVLSVAPSDIGLFIGRKESPTAGIERT
jgi:2-polyprenyl-3-methyl-5-hydroxy-6-metoxy-1,4-benzoquinol methylase